MRFAQLQVQMLCLPRNLQWFPVSTVYDPLERLQGTPLGAVLPPHRESHAGNRSASVDEAEDWDALESELAGRWVGLPHTQKGSPWPQVTPLTV